MNCHQVVFIPNTDVTGTNRGPRQILGMTRNLEGAGHSTHNRS